MKFFSSNVLAVIGVMTIVAACAPNPYKTTNRAHKNQVKALSKTIRELPLRGISSDSIPPSPYYAGTTNFNLRRPNFVIIHHTAQSSCDQTLRTFTLPRTQVSAHYVICKDGTVFQMLNDYLRAWHGGVSKWGNLSDINSASIGIELDNNGFEPFSPPQVKSLLTVLDTLKKRHNIPVANFIGHSDIAPTRKVDPNIFFPWRELADRGFGNWYDDTTGVVVPEHFDHIQALRIVGYDTNDTTAALMAFKRHFVRDTVRMLSEADKKILYSVYRKY